MDSPACLNSSGRAGSGADAATLREAGHTTMPVNGAPTVTVPGCVDGWHALSERYGSLHLRSVRSGHPAGRGRLSRLAGVVDGLDGQRCPTADAGLGASHVPGGAAPAVGQRISRPFLAGSLRATAAGQDAFYLDRVGSAIPEATRNLITRDDLSRCQARWVAPLSAALFGRTAWTTPPNSQGYLTLATLSIFEQLDPTMDPEHPDYWHALIEAYRSMAWERDHCLYDPDTGPDLAMLDPEKLADRRNRIDPAAAGSWRRPVPAAGGTAYMCTVDGDGMGVSLIQSNFHGIGSGLSAGRTGVWLHNRGAGFNLIPGHPNEWIPGRRPLHTLSSTIWTEGNRLALVLGTRGGHQQPQLLAQMGAHLHHAGLEPGVAQAVHCWTIQDINTTASMVSVESRTGAGIVNALRDRGHRISIDRSWEHDWGPISAISLSPNGLREAVADPRVETALALSL